MKPIQVKYSEIKRAIGKGKALDPRDWQCELVEILLIPKVYRRWRAINKARFPDPTVERHPGKSASKHDQSEEGRYKNWLEIAGYSLRYGYAGVCWNSPTDDYYGHSGGTTWNGLRRETTCSFAESLRLCAFLTDEGKEIPEYVSGRLAEFQFEFVNDKGTA